MVSNLRLTNEVPWAMLNFSSYRPTIIYCIFLTCLGTSLASCSSIKLQADSSVSEDSKCKNLKLRYTKNVDGSHTHPVGTIGLDRIQVEHPQTHTHRLNTSCVHFHSWGTKAYIERESKRNQKL